MDPKTSGVQRSRDSVKKSLEKGNTEELAEEAKKALEGPEGDELRKAEEAAKSGTPGAERGQDRRGANEPVSK